MYRPKPMDYRVSDVDAEACTHFIYSFAGLRDNEIVALDKEEDLGEDGGK